MKVVIKNGIMLLAFNSDQELDEASRAHIPLDATIHDCPDLDMHLVLADAAYPRILFEEIQKGRQERGMENFTDKDHIRVFSFMVTSLALVRYRLRYFFPDKSEDANLPDLAEMREEIQTWDHELTEKLLTVTAENLNNTVAFAIKQKSSDYCAEIQNKWTAIMKALLNPQGGQEAR